MISKNLGDVVEHDLQELIANQIPEGRMIEYKRELPGKLDSDKKEFLADVSSFANTSGGDLIYGMEEANGFPSNILGLNIGDLDAEKRRLDSILSSGVTPRFSYSFGVVACSAGTILIIRVDRSWAGPHRIVFQGSDKFYARNQAGKYPLDLNELRQAFTRGLSVSERMRAFRLDRIIEVSNDRTPVPISSGPRVLLHVLPLDSFDQTAQFDPIQFSRNPTRVPLLGSSLSLLRVNFDGVVIHNGRPTSTTYTQIFRSGALEVCNGRILAHSYEGRNVIPNKTLEQSLLAYMPSLFSILETMDVRPPVAVALTLLNVKGLEIMVDHWDSEPGFPISEHQLFLPEQIVDDFSVSPELILKPVFDQIWNACGYESSRNFNEKDNWIGSVKTW